MQVEDSILEDNEHEMAVAELSVAQKKHWCNFCGFTSDSLTDYLAHSCVDTIEASGKKIVSTGRNECS
jgi:hypothetical protein